MYQQIREAGQVLARFKAAEEIDGEVAAEMASAMENLMRAAAGHDPELADVVDEMLGSTGWPTLATLSDHEKAVYAVRIEDIVGRYDDAGRAGEAIADLVNTDLLPADLELTDDAFYWGAKKLEKRLEPLYTLGKPKGIPEDLGLELLGLVLDEFAGRS